MPIDVTRLDPSAAARIIRPSQDIVLLGDDYHLMYGTWVGYRKADEDKVIQLPVFIFDNKVILDKSEIEARGFIMKAPPLPMEEPRWSIKAIKDWKLGNLGPPRPRDLLNDVSALLAEYIDFEPNFSLYTLVSLWIIGTYFYMGFHSYPYLNIVGIMQSGKSKLQRVISLLAFNGMSNIDPTAATVFRLVDRAQPTLCVDEMEYLSNPDSRKGLQIVLNAGYQKGMAYVPRTEKTEKGRFLTGMYFLFSPKSISSIAGVTGPLADRCIPIIMRRTLSKRIMQNMPWQYDPVWQRTRDMLYIFALENWRKIQETYLEVEMPFDMNGRDWELFRPIWAIAEHFGVTDEIEGLMKQLIEQRQTEHISENRDYVLAQSLIFHAKEDRWYTLSEIREDMRSTLGVDNIPKWLSPQWLGKALTRLGFTEKRRTPSGMQYFIRRADVIRLAIRLGLPLEEEDTKVLDKQETLTGAPATLAECIDRVVEWASGQVRPPDYLIEAEKVREYIRAMGFPPDKVLSVLIRDGFMSKAPFTGMLVLNIIKRQVGGGEVED